MLKRNQTNRSGMRQFKAAGKGVQALSVPTEVGLSQPFLPLRLTSKSWETCPFNKALYCSQTDF